MTGQKLYNWIARLAELLPGVQFDSVKQKRDGVFRILVSFGGRERMYAVPLGKGLPPVEKVAADFKPKPREPGYYWVEWASSRGYEPAEWTGLAWYRIGYGGRSEIPAFVGGSIVC